jgi:HMG box factor
MIIYVATVTDGSVMTDDAVEVKEGGRVVFVRKEADESARKGWDEKIVRRLGFEVGEIVRSLKGFGS